jgi:hypothetical protein
MTITLNLPPATIEKLEAQAAASGKDVETIIREAVEVKLAVSRRTFREIMAPVHEDFRRSGMSEGELEGLVDEAVADARAARKTMRKQQ